MERKIQPDRRELLLKNLQILWQNNEITKADRHRYAILIRENSSESIERLYQSFRQMLSYTGFPDVIRELISITGGEKNEY